MLRLAGDSFRDFETALSMGGSDAQALSNLCFLLDSILPQSAKEGTQLLYEYALAMHPTHARLNYYFGKHLADRAMKLHREPIWDYPRSFAMMIRARAYYRNALRLSETIHSSIAKDLANLYQHMHHQINIGKLNLAPRPVQDWNWSNLAKGKAIYKEALQVDPTHSLTLKNYYRLEKRMTSTA